MQLEVNTGLVLSRTIKQTYYFQCTTILPTPVRLLVDDYARVNQKSDAILSSKFLNAFGRNSRRILEGFQ